LQLEKQRPPIVLTVDGIMILSKEHPKNAVSEMQFNIEPEQNETDRSLENPNPAKRNGVNGLPFPSFRLKI
jgi:hypothetical protein